MSAHFDTMMEPRVEDLLEAAGSKFSLVALAAQRARQINTYYTTLGEGLGHIVPPQVTSTASKSLSIAFEEIAAGAIVGVKRSEIEAAEAQAAADAAALDAEAADAEAADAGADD
ncbi:MAG: DNA-directed RNA polymerase subunit omega [Microthrixaceae bacterium]|nr:DNA-directed RNA polymerase subunit omega [Microthrixaceae bacterium]MCO5314428.1 DNA-directed RNA polymerase subunit omega [Microthrixaceae bacterium]HPB45714.1 DNA-directed RNA polymerase subunit omega [Microthrixaceae bacterium]